jgi:hypothetical protein
MVKRIIVFFLLVLFFGCSSSNYAVISTDVCQDEMYLSLKKLPLSSLTPQELQYMLEKERQCLEAKKINQIGLIEQRLQSIDKLLWTQFSFGIFCGIIVGIMMIAK